MMGGGMAMQSRGDAGPASHAFNGISARMHKDMIITYMGQPDVDFVKGMIPHHQAAVDMAKTEIAFGKDPRKTAEDIIKSQEVEIGKLKKRVEIPGARTGHKIAVATLAVGSSQNSHQFGNLFALFGDVTARHCVGNAVPDMILQNSLFDATQCGANGGYLRNDVDAIAVLFDHPRDAADLTLDFIETLEARVGRFLFHS
jgi:hypothetical protein